MGGTNLELGMLPKGFICGQPHGELSGTISTAKPMEVIETGHSNSPAHLFPSEVFGAGCHHRAGGARGGCFQQEAGIPDSQPVLGVNSLLGVSATSQTCRQHKSPSEGKGLERGKGNSSIDGWGGRMEERTGGRIFIPVNLHE